MIVQEIEKEEIKPKNNIKWDEIRKVFGESFHEKGKAIKKKSRS